MNKRKIITVIMATCFMVIGLCGCGSTDSSIENTAPQNSTIANDQSAEADTAEASTTGEAAQTEDQTKKILRSPKKEMLVLACYLTMDPELLDAVAISTLGGFTSNAGKFVGSKMFGYEAREGYCITNLGKIKSEIISEAAFIPPASPANKKAWGVLTVNDKMRICVVESGR